MKYIKFKNHTIGFTSFLLVSIMAFCSGCASKEHGQDAVKPEPAGEKLSIYMYQDFPAEKARMLEKELKKYFPEVELVHERRPLPQGAYVAKRNRYRGTGLLDDMQALHSGSAVLALTDRIICIKNDISPDFGIMGISRMNTGLAVVSSKIPKSGKTQTDSNLVKLALHELGHAYGLPHCPDQKCYMVDAEHRMKLPQTTDFCPKCREHLQKKGVRL